MKKGFGLMGILLSVEVIAFIVVGGSCISSTAGETSKDKGKIDNMIIKAEDVKNKRKEICGDISNNLDETTDLPSKSSATEDWETYRNDLFAFEVKYPTEWNIWTTETQISLRSTNFSQTPNQDEINILVIQSHPPDNLEMFDERLLEAYRSFAHITIGGKSAIRFSDLVPGHRLFRYFETILIDADSYVLRIYRVGGTNSDVQEQIISTLNFIDS